MSTATVEPTTFLWLEITGRCQLECTHCYADSSPLGDHGTMSTTDWRAVIDAAAELEVGMVQLIGGEPTLHPDLPDLVDYALTAGIDVEIYTNLLHVTDALWKVFTRPGVRLATSYYAADPAGHEAVTGRKGSHGRTRANIAEAVRRSVPLRVGLIDTGNGGDVDAAHADLLTLGVSDEEIGMDQARGFGRAATIDVDLGGTCGDCGHGTAAIGPDGTVTPCVFTRHAVAGNVHSTALGAILAGGSFSAQVERLDQLRRTTTVACKPNPKCAPASSCAPSCTPSDTGNKGSNCKPKGK
ncbi:radical SAM/SPASM domain-containing protein [Parafrankia discariae]|uniref:radical SAM/SPASM domain-containing protein n=1 Tax=Parafrankia discariae TaxID=365528 RepID=UPI0003A375EC|nr:radical SAM/SPASM domain-containing protein [Parafrankia discariae]